MVPLSNLFSVKLGDSKPSRFTQKKLRGLLVSSRSIMEKNMKRWLYLSNDIFLYPLSGAGFFTNRMISIWFRRCIPCSHCWQKSRSKKTYKNRIIRSHFKQALESLNISDDIVVEGVYFSVKDWNPTTNSIGHNFCHSYCWWKKILHQLVR